MMNAMYGRRPSGRAFSRLIRIGFLKQWQYKQATLLLVVSQAIFLVIQYYLWESIFAAHPLGNYTFSEMFTYIMLVQLTYSLYPSRSSAMIGEMLRTGGISSVLTRPISIYAQLFFESIGSGLYRFVFVCLPYIALGSIFITITNDAVIWTWLVVFLLSYMIFFTFEMIMGTISFYTNSSWGIQSLKLAIIALLTGRYFPLELYPSWLLSLCKWLPFQYMFNYPVEILMGKQTVRLHEVIYEIMMLSAMVVLYCLANRAAMRKISVQGG